MLMSWMIIGSIDENKGTYTGGIYTVEIRAMAIGGNLGEKVSYDLHAFAFWQWH